MAHAEINRFCNLFLSKEPSPKYGFGVDRNFARFDITGAPCSVYYFELTISGVA